MHAVATCSLDVQTPESLCVEYKPLPADAKRIAEKLLAAGGGAALERATLAQNSNLVMHLNAEAQGGGGPPAADAPGAGLAMAAAAAAAAAAARATAAAAAARARVTELADRDARAHPCRGGHRRGRRGHRSRGT